MSSLVISIGSIIATILVMLVIQEGKSTTANKDRAVVNMKPDFKNLEDEITTLKSALDRKPDTCPACPGCPDCKCEYEKSPEQPPQKIVTQIIEKIIERPAKRPSLIWYEHMKLAVEKENLGQVYYGVQDTAWTMGYVTWQCPPGFELSRLGPMFEGGKNACLPPKSKRAAFAGKCLIYSFGSNGQFEFEVDMHDRFGCEIHTFDCTLARPGHAPSYVNYHQWCLGAPHPDPSVAVYMSYWQMVEKLGFTKREPLLVKMDIEGYEWIFFGEYFAPNSPIPRITQFLVEIHDGRAIGSAFPWPPAYKPNPPINQLIEGQGQNIQQILNVYMDLDKEFDMAAREHNMYPNGAMGCIQCHEFTFTRRDYNWSQWGVN
jgi:hypothetical protein